MSESGEGFIDRKGNAIWGTELLQQKKEMKVLDGKEVIKGNFINNEDGK